MTFGPRTTISPTLPRGTSRSSESTIRSSTQFIARPAEYILPLWWCASQWYSGSSMVPPVVNSVMP
ncbi:hypothetical protein FQZ97_585900 [compost metagenome]